MVKRTIAALVTASFLSMQCMPGPAFAENQMGYQLLTAEQAASLPRGGGSLGMEVGRAEQITDSGMTFDVMRVKGVRRGSAAAQAGFKMGDQIIAVDGRVFPSVAAFAAYVGSVQPGRQISVDYMPQGGGPQQAQRVSVTLAQAGNGAAVPQTQEAEKKGLSTGTKVAIGIGAAALFGCYKFGCFSHRSGTPQGAGAR